MELSNRKEKIIEAVVDNYINKCEPVSSSEIRDRYLPALSSATIRNELVALEELGYLTQPHTSAGRIPTAEAYRLYVEKLMPTRKLTQSELMTVAKYFNGKLTEIDDILKSTAKVISEITNLTSVAYMQNYDDARIENIKIVKISEQTALIIIVTDRGMLKNTSADISPNTEERYFMDAGHFVTNVFKGYKISEAIDTEKAIKEAMLGYEMIFETVLKILKSYSSGEAEYLNDIVFEGSAKLLSQPEYANVKKAQAMLELLDAKEVLIPVLKNKDDLNLNILISKDNEIRKGLPECAIITAKYSVNGINIGNAGVIGPIRMDYSKVISVLDYIGKTINTLPETVCESIVNKNTINKITISEKETI